MKFKSRLKLFIFILVGITLIYILFVYAQKYYWVRQFKNTNAKFLIETPWDKSNSIQLYDLSLGKMYEIFSLPKYNSRLSKEYFMPGGVRLNASQSMLAIQYTGVTNGILVYDLIKSKIVFEFLRPDYKSRVLYSWSPDGNYLAYSYSEDEHRFMVSNQYLYLINLLSDPPIQTQIDPSIQRKQLVGEPFESFTWLKDDQSIVFRKNNLFKKYSYVNHEMMDISIEQIKYDFWRDVARFEWKNNELSPKPGQNISMKSSDCGFFIIFCRHFLFLDGKKVLSSGTIRYVEWMDYLNHYIIEAPPNVVIMNDQGKKHTLSNNGELIDIIHPY